ncbi:hypothetical protein QP938_08400 [Porticoccaceae bacterium LTM1]|nr:hypothetical protein QP938_08400 [Porticoccaceae bacterium LTM1]
MDRVHLLEIEDQSWCPKVLRYGITDLLRFYLNVGKFYQPITPILNSAIQDSKADQIIDLCSGGGGPWLSMLPQLNQHRKVPIKLHLTDKYPNLEALESIHERWGDNAIIHQESCDATQMPENLNGFRTLFTSFHHFRPEQCQQILQDAVNKNQGIAIFEFTQRSFLSIFMMLFAPIMTLLVIPFTKPFRWSNLLFTYLIPILPLIAMFDGLVSCIRTYSPRELQKLVDALENNNHEWKIGIKKGGLLPNPITYLVGTPPTIKKPE